MVAMNGEGGISSFRTLRIKQDFHVCGCRNAPCVIFRICLSLVSWNMGWSKVNYSCLVPGEAVVDAEREGTLFMADGDRGTCPAVGYFSIR